LLAALAVVAMLVLLLLPSLSRAKSKSKAVPCVNHMRQIGSASAMYSADNQGVVVPMGRKLPQLPANRLIPYGPYLWWPDILKPYMKISDAREYACPMVPDKQAGITLSNT